MKGTIISDGIQSGVLYYGTLKNGPELEMETTEYINRPTINATVNALVSTKRELISFFKLVKLCLLLSLTSRHFALRVSKDFSCRRL